MSKLIFRTNITNINSWNIIHLPKAISNKLSSRGMLIIEARINDCIFKVELEPDGSGSHWLKLSDDFMDKIKANQNDEISIEFEETKWFKPQIPLDFIASLEDENLLDAWNLLTTKAQWEWIRWIRFTKNEVTRQKRIKTACSMLQSGKKRPCCFDQTRCTQTHVCNSGVLLSK